MLSIESLQITKRNDNSNQTNALDSNETIKTSERDHRINDLSYRTLLNATVQKGTIYGFLIGGWILGPYSISPFQRTFCKYSLPLSEVENWSACHIFANAVASIGGTILGGTAGAAAGFVYGTYKYLKMKSSDL